MLQEILNLKPFESLKIGLFTVYCIDYNQYDLMHESEGLFNDIPMNAQEVNKYASM